MREQENKTVDLNRYIRMHHLKRKRQQEGRYQCILAGNRLEGACDVVIYDYVQNYAELFCMHFSEDGVIGHHYLGEEELAAWKYNHEVVGISYLQAITLLGDAVRQNYKYRTQDVWPVIYDSLHIQRTWQKEYYDCESCSLHWLLQGMDLISFVEVYLKAIGNKDAVLLYDMLAEEKRYGISRELYAYSWNHVLEEVQILNFEIVYIEPCTGQNGCNLYLTLCGVHEENGLMSIDMCVKIIFEDQRYHLFHEQVIEANHISRY